MCTDERPKGVEKDESATRRSGERWPVRPRWRAELNLGSGRLPMRLKPRQLLLTAIVMAGGVAGTMPLAWAQGQPQTSETLKSESTGPQDPRSTGSVGRSTAPLSDKLDRTDGVIRPPADIAPEMSVRPPVPNPGTTRVIPPPGSPGGDQTIEPK